MKKQPVLLSDKPREFSNYLTIQILNTKKRRLSWVEKIICLEGPNSKSIKGPIQEVEVVVVPMQVRNFLFRIIASQAFR